MTKQGSGNYSFGEVFAIVGAVVTATLFILGQINEVQVSVRELQTIVQEVTDLREQVNDIDDRLKLIERAIVLP